MRVRVLVGAALALVVAALAIVLSERGERMAGSNDLPDSVFVVTLPGGAQACQHGEPVPAAGRRVRLLVGTFRRPVPALGVEIRPPGGAPLRGELPAGGREGYVKVPLERTTSPLSRATVCVRNGGRRKIVVAGFPTPPEMAARVGRRAADGKIKLEYLRPGRESWWALAPTVAHRFGIGKAGFFGDWTLAAAGLLLLAAWLVALTLVLRARST